LYITNWICNEFLLPLMENFTDPKKRVSLYYLLSAIFIAGIWSTWAKKLTIRETIKELRYRLFGKKLWLSDSARGDYKLFLANHTLLILTAPLLISKVTISTSVFFFLHNEFPAGAAVIATVSPVLVATVYTVFLFLVDDFSRFATHLALHRWSFLWVFHKTHHSAETMTPFTVYRAHPVEALIFSLRSIVVQASSIALFVFLFGSSIELVTIYGVNVFLFIFNATGANLRHSHVQIRYGRLLERLVICPGQHQVHHSIDPRHHNKNFGAALAIWDWAAGTLCMAPKENQLEFGLDKSQKIGLHSLKSLYFSPFLPLVRALTRWKNTIHLTCKKRSKHAF